MSLDASLVPQDLRDMLPIAEEWGLLSQGQQDTKLQRLLREDPEGATALRTKVEPYRVAIREWNQKLFGDKTHVSQYSDEDQVHPYWAFLSTLKVVDSIPWDGNKNDPAVIAAQDRSRAEIEAHLLSQTRYNAIELFSKKDYAGAANLYRSIAEHLTRAEQAKLKFCEKKNGEKPAPANPSSHA